MPGIVHAADAWLAGGRRDRTFIVVLAPVVQVPVELEARFVVVERDLPSRDQPAASPPSRVISRRGDAPAAVLDAASGLSSRDAKNVFSLAR